MHHFDNSPPVPLTLEGSSILHQMLRIKWPEWRALPSARRNEILGEVSVALPLMEVKGSALFSLLGHKGDLLLIHFRTDFEALGEAERALTKLALWDYVEQTNSYLSVVELGLYESTAKVYGALAERGVEPHTPAWNAEIEETLARQRTAMHSRLFPEVPPHKYVCFYPMDRRRGEQKNWYQLRWPSASGKCPSTAKWAAATPAGSSRSSPAPSASTTGSGAWTCSPKIRWCLNISFMK
jgi:peroxiredoxin